MESKLDPSVLELWNLYKKTLNPNGQLDKDNLEKIQAQTRKATISLKGDTRQLLAIGTAADNYKADMKWLDAKWWRTSQGQKTSQNPALDGKPNQLTIYMQVDKRGYVFRLKYDAKMTVETLINTVDPLIAYAGIWTNETRIQWGPTLLMFGAIRLDSTLLRSSLADVGVTAGCLLHALHPKRKQVIKPEIAQKKQKQKKRKREDSS